MPEQTKTAMPAMPRLAVCCLCKTKDTVGYGNNPSPFKNKGKCCDECNLTKVLPARMFGLRFK